ncbi:MAG: ankyrin repeat domain-containing protein [Myxococcales bacterium]|nr:ankyrin repeat domain-containing protein [Myxococcales bacterium]
MSDLYQTYRPAQQAIEAGDVDAVRRHLAGLDLNPVGPAPLHPPLHWAVCQGQRALLPVLLELGARVDHDAAGPAGGWTYLPPHGAAHGSHLDLVQWLLDRGCPTDLATAIALNDADAARALATPESLATPVWIIRYSVLHWAADQGRPDMVRLLVELGLSANQRDGDGHAPLRYAARNAPDLAVCQALLDCGADPNHASKTGITALTSACRHRQSLPTVRWLLQNGADPNQATRDRTTPLHKAVANRVLPMVELLLEYGADPHRLGKKGQTPLDVARAKGATAIVERLEGTAI